MSSFSMMTLSLWQAAGWTMLHFLWIGTVFAILVALIEQAVKRRSPEARYSVAVTNLFVLAFIPVCLLGWKLSQAPGPTAGVPEVVRTDARWGDSSTSDTIPRGDELANLVTTSETRADSVIPGDLVSLSGVESNEPPQNMSTTGEFVALPLRTQSTVRFLAGLGVTAVGWLMMTLPWIWVIGFPLTCCTLLIGISGAERFRRRCQILDSSHPAAVMCRQLQATLNLRQRVLLGVTDKISMPILVGIFRPLILFPASTLSGISAEQLEMILLHELAHVRRWDNLINLLQRVIEAVLFFHPVVWRLSNRVRLEREHCCDATVLTYINAPQNYAEMLVQMAFTNSSPDWVLGTSISHQLIPRIRRILNQE